MADSKLRLVSLTVLGGALDGRRHDPEEVVTEILVGSDPDCHLVVDLPGVSPIHARVWADLDQSVVYDTHALRGLYVNATPVEGQAPIGEGDVLWLGPPQEPDSVCVQCHFAPWVEVLPPRAASTDDDPFFLGDAPGGGFVPPPKPAPAVEEPLVEEAMPETEASRVPGPPPPEALSPEALVAETIADDWAIAEAEPAVPPAAPPPPFFAPEVPAPPEAVSTAADEFFVAEEPLAEAVVEAEFVEAEPLPLEPVPSVPSPVFELPPLEPIAVRPSERAPLPPQRAAALPPAPSPLMTSLPEIPADPETPAFAIPSEPEPEPELLAEVAPEAPPVPMPAPEPAPVEPPRSAPRPRVEPSPARRPAPSGTARPAPSRRPGPSARPARRRSGGTPEWLRPVGLGAAACVLLGAVVLVALRFLGGGVRLDGVEPARLRVGQRATLTGSGFASDPAGNSVLFDDRQAKVLQASPTRLEVEVPEAVAESGAERRVGVVVKNGRRASRAVDVAVFQGPRLHGISPEAALPGEEVVLAGAGWGPGATVRFGDAPAQLNDLQATRIRAIVPDGAGVPGTPAPVVVTVGGVESNPAPFIVGHLPVVSTVSPASAAAGDTVTVSGRGFQADPLGNDVRLGGVPALVLSATGDAMKVVVPRVGPGEPARALEVRVPGSTSVGLGTLQIAAPADPVEFRFVAEPFTAVSGRSHAVLSTGLGPAFVLAASGGKSAAARAVEAAGRLNDAAQALRTTVGLNLEARGLDASPVLGLAGKPEALLDVTEADAAAYNEDWTGLRGRGGPVTRARLARWWEALGRDIVLLTVRGEKPRFAAALAPEGRALVQLFEAAQRTGRPGVPRQVVDEARAPLRDGLRLLALRVPASVTAPVTPPVGGAPSALPAAAATPPPARLQLEGTWAGSQVEQGQRQYISVAVRRGGGSISYEGGITLTVPLLTLEESRRDQVRFSVQIRGGIRHYAGKWDGEAITGSISTDAAGRDVVASFELRRR
ncbi:MAG TPA: IPT/TIG domain-containing protein [Vicinamibacteria bacterium]|nr:IPT/TIG domain-containing protein [Vicinamibacteria bacterium]